MRAPGARHGPDAAAAGAELEAERPAPAEAERADAGAVAGVASEQAIDRGVERVHGARRLERGRELARSLRRLAGEASDPVRSQRDEALARESIADVAAELREPIRLVDDEHAAPEARRRLGEIGAARLRGNGVGELATRAHALHAAPSAWASCARSITVRRASGTLRAMPPEPDARAFQNVPPAVLGLVRVLADAGHEAVLVGGCVRDLLRGVRVADFDLATAAAPEQVLALFPRAIPIGLAHGTVMVPTAAGPVDVTSYRAGPSLRDDLAHRDFTLNALAWSPEKGALIDPFGGSVDLAQERLRAVGSARERLAEDPLRMLRAARLVAQLGVRADAELEQALQEAHATLAGVARERVRRELALLLLAPHAGAGLALLRRTQLEAVLAPGAAPDAAEVVPALPLDLELRLAAWLRGARVAAVLRSHRYSRRVIARVEHLLRLHPIEAGAHAPHDASLRRLLRRAGEHDFDALVALRHAELVRGEAARRSDAATASERLRELEQAVARVRHSGALALHRFDLAIRGDEVMRLIGSGPGPHVGRALRFLTECVIEDPACNTPDALRARLADWQAERNSAASRPPPA